MSSREIIIVADHLSTDASFFKDRLFAKLAISADDPGAWLMNAETDDEWLEMLTSEVMNEKGEYVEVGPNHGLDCSFMHLVLHYYYKIDLMKKPGQKVERKTKKSNSKTGGYRRPSYMGE